MPSEQNASGAQVPRISLLDAVKALRVEMDASARNMPGGLDPLGDAARTFRICAGMLQEIIEKHEESNREVTGE